MTATATASATERAAQLDKEIFAAQRELVDLAASAPALSPRGLALAHLGEGGPTTSAAAVADHADVVAHATARRDGLIELRLEVEPARLREELDALDVQIAAVNARRQAPLARLEEAKAELERCEGELGAIMHETALLRQKRHVLDVATRAIPRGEPSEYLDRLFDRVGAEPALRRSIRERLADPAAVRRARGE